MKRYNSCDVNNMSFREIIEELFSFKKVSEDVNPFDIQKLILADINEKVWENNIISEFDVDYNYSVNKNTITFSNPETGELLMILEQTPNMLPTSQNRWHYEIVFVSWEFNHSFKIGCGFAVLMGEG